MNIKELYARVTLTFPVSEPDFFAYYNDVVRSLYSRYGEEYTTGCQPIDIQALDDSSPLFEDYYMTAYYGVLSSATGDQNHRSSYLIEGDAAYTAVWRRLSRNKTVKVTGRRR